MTAKTATKVLNFKDNKIQELTLPELKSTVKEEDYNGKPIMGMYHWEFIEKALQEVEKAKLRYTLDPVWAAQNSDKTRPGVSVIEKYREEHGEGAVQSFLLRRIFSRIIVSDLENDQTNTAIAISYNQLGFQLAFGPHVKICKNLCIMGGNKFMSTYQVSDRMPGPERMIEVLGDWLKDFEAIRKQELELINRFQETMVPDDEVHEIIGELTVKRIRKENPAFPREPLNPLNQSQIGKFTEGFLIKRAEEPNKIFSLWDVFNMATELYKPGDTDFPLILSSNQAMSQYLANKYTLLN